ncbi:hypothetical protein Droror1_Dr00007679 [Drosera rotundifolia]
MNPNHFPLSHHHHSSLLHPALCLCHHNLPGQLPPLPSLNPSSWSSPLVHLLSLTNPIHLGIRHDDTIEKRKEIDGVSVERERIIAKEGADEVGVGCEERVDLGEVVSEGRAWLKMVTRLWRKLELVFDGENVGFPSWEFFLSFLSVRGLPSYNLLLCATDLVLHREIFARGC